MRGFQLSFTAVYALILLAPLLQRPIARLGSIASGMDFKQALRSWWGTLPASAYFFQKVQFPLAGYKSVCTVNCAGLFDSRVYRDERCRFSGTRSATLFVCCHVLRLDVIFAVATYGGFHFSKPKSTVGSGLSYLSCGNAVCIKTLPAQQKAARFVCCERVDCVHRFVDNHVNKKSADPLI